MSEAIVFTLESIICNLQVEIISESDGLVEFKTISLQSCFRRMDR